MNVGVRELRDGLSRYLAAVQTGEDVVVTDHGRPVVRMSAYGEQSELEKLVADGLVTLPTAPKTMLPEPVRTAGTVSDLISEQRR